MLSSIDAATWLPRLIETSLRTIPVLLPPVMAARISSKPLPLNGSFATQPLNVFQITFGDVLQLCLMKDVEPALVNCNR